MALWSNIHGCAQLDVTGPLAVLGPSWAPRLKGTKSLSTLSHLGARARAHTHVPVLTPSSLPHLHSSLLQLLWCSFPSCTSARFKGIFPQYFEKTVLKCPILCCISNVERLQSWFPFSPFSSHSFLFALFYCYSARLFSSDHFWENLDVSSSNIACFLFSVLSLKHLLAVCPSSWSSSPSLRLYHKYWLPICHVPLITKCRSMVH